MSVNIDDLLKNIEKELLPIKNEYKNCLSLEQHTDEDFKYSFLGAHHSYKCFSIYQHKVSVVFHKYIETYKGKIDLINHLEFKDLHFNSIYKTHDFL